MTGQKESYVRELVLGETSRGLLEDTMGDGIVAVIGVVFGVADDSLQY